MFGSRKGERKKKNLTHLKCLAAVLAPKGVQTFALNYLFRELFKKKSGVKEEIFRQGNKSFFFIISVIVLYTSGAA